MVIFSALALIVAGNVTAGASPDAAVTGRLSGTSDTHSVISRTISLFTGGTNPTPKPPEHKSAKHDTSQSQDNDADSSSTSNSGNSSNSAGQASPAQSAPKLAVNVNPPVCVQGQMTYNVTSATLTFQTPTATAGTLAWSWETQVTSGGNSDAAPTSSNSGSQSMAASTSKVTITANDPTQPLFSTVANVNYVYKFRLHITGPVDISSGWIPVPQESSPCSTN